MSRGLTGILKASSRRAPRPSGRVWTAAKESRPVPAQAPGGLASVLTLHAAGLPLCSARLADWTACSVAVGSCGRFSSTRAGAAKLRGRRCSPLSSRWDRFPYDSFTRDSVTPIFWQTTTKKKKSQQLRFKDAERQTDINAAGGEQDRPGPVSGSRWGGARPFTSPLCPGRNLHAERCKWAAWRSRLSSCHSGGGGPR